jgi:hypothetical protein
VVKLSPALPDPIPVNNKHSQFVYQATDIQSKYL